MKKPPGVPAVFWGSGVSFSYALFSPAAVGGKKQKYEK
jgi:hypothetical protein